MRSSKRILPWLIGALFTLSASPAFADGLFLRIQGEAQGHTGFFGLIWNDQAQSISAFGYKGSDLGSSTRDKLFGTKNVAEMSTGPGSELVYRVRGPFGIVVSTVKIRLKLSNVVRHAGFDEGDLTVSASGQGQAMFHLTHSNDRTLRTTYQNQVTDQLYFKDGQVSRTPF